MFDFFKTHRHKKLAWQELQVEPTDSKDFGPCSCCGNMSRTVWGFVNLADATIAAYFVQWTLNNPKHGANFDLIVGQWGEKPTSQKRQAISMEYRIIDGQGSFMVIDANTREFANNELVSTVLRREDVIGKPVADEAFAIVDAIFAKEERMVEVRNWV
jgi:hypothetical protein